MGSERVGHDWVTEHTHTYTHCSLCACVLPCFSGARLFADPMDCSPPGSSLHGDSPGKNAGEGFHALLPGIFMTQGWNLPLLWLLHCRRILYCWATWEDHTFFLSVAIPHIKISGWYLHIDGRMKMEKANETFRERILTIKIPKTTGKPRTEITI